MSEKNNHYSLIILRAALGIIFFAHGSQKLLGWFGGYGFDATMQFFQQIGIPAFIAMLIILGEFFGGILILSGLSRSTCLMVSSFQGTKLAMNMFLLSFSLPSTLC
jgi:uncharacterized membrane protein YphA (DoxX/SURF4 family)